MADKYCDHGAYGDAVFGGYVSNTASNDNGVAGNILTVTAITSGIINIGSEISGGTIPAGTYISGFTSGTQGGVGVYTTTMAANNAATFILRASTGLIGKYAHPLNVPLTWALPQEGDGTATTTATASATVSVDMSTWTFASGSSTFSVMGCTALTIGAGANSATNAQYSATYATMLANIRAAINLATANTVNIPAGWTATQVRNTVYARVNGQNLELMTRAGSASYNTMTALTFTNVTGSSSQTWSGGSGGCWGYLANINASIWPSAMASTNGSNYGVLGGVPAIAGWATAGDTVHLRTGKIIYGAYQQAWLLLPTFIGTVSAECEYRVDATQSVWTADPANSVIEYRKYAAYYQNQPSSLRFTKGDGIFFNAPRTANGSRSFVLKVAYGDSGGGMSVNGSSVYKVRVNGISLESSVSGAHDNLYLAQNTSDGFLTFTDCYVKNANNNPPIAIEYSGGSTSFMTLVNCEFDATSASVANLGIVTLNNQLNFQLIGCKFTGYISGSKLTAASVTAPCTLELTSCQLGNIDLRGPVLGGFTYGAKNTYVIAVESSDPSRDFSVETRRGLTEWNSKRSFPYLNAKLHDGITPWSVRMLPSQSATSALRTAPFEGPSLSKINTLANGTRTATLELLIADTLTLTTADIELLCMYINTSNAQQVVSTLTVAGSALNSSTAAWSSTVFVEGGSVNFNKFKIEATLPNVKSGVVMAFLVRVFKNVSNTTQSIFIDPEISVV